MFYVLFSLLWREGFARYLEQPRHNAAPAVQSRNLQGEPRTVVPATHGIELRVALLSLVYGMVALT